MSYNKIKIKEGINLHTISTNKFKTNIVSIFLTISLNRENITKEALIPAVLRLGTNNIKSQEELNKKLEEMYGANFNCGIEKRGNNHVLKFYIESIDNQFTLEKEDLLEESTKLLLDIVLNPLKEQNGFNEQHTNGEKENLKRIIRARIDNKANYAYTRCIEEMYKNKPYGLYEYGYIEDLQTIDSINLYEYYKQLLNKCKIDIIVSTKEENIQTIKKTIKEDGKIAALNSRKPQYESHSMDEINENEHEITEAMDIAQGKLVIGLNIENYNNKAAISVYNAILGSGANSKLFQNVREKAGLAYTAGSVYLKSKNNIFIRCGIEIENYKKAVKIIKEQLEDIKNGEFSKEDIENAKQLIIAGLSSIKDEQGNEISYYMSQELENNKTTIEEYIEEIKNVSREEILKTSNTIKINTIYFLKNN